MATNRGGLVRCALSGALGVAVVAAALPRVTGTDWADIAATLGRVGSAPLLALSVLWLAGLWVHTPALTTALPGLSHRRALLLNLTGSCVSNLLPLGGAAGTVLNWRMARGWGFGSAAYARWALVTNLFDTLTKLLLPGVVLCWFALSADAPTGRLVTPALVGVALLVVAGGAVALIARDDRAVRRLGGWMDAAARRIRRLPAAPEGWGERGARFRADSAGLVRHGWGRMLGGKLGYAALQAALLWACLAAVGVRADPVVVASAFVVERLLSMVVLTPGAAGIVEVGMAGALAGFGVTPAAAAAGVLLYRFFVLGMEVPVGGLALLGWWLGTRRVRTTPSGSPSGPVHARPGVTTARRPLARPAG
ncbi:flippase-like domain-containing protein [Phycicoccus sp. CSK15P-2]|uniref:lysylphosphatidylglycerol synthase transmembrane domain-containing protein n=1 Tax=Phycicoccus sp. CSK15P-2 TaxID=2807627 RepID=UPI00195286C8|nr:lysylphosphatidylglycerol synthase transmembrane domain-containing protein [Phycicoccus sp. CSK15P-2]MBM6403054.1 flippase-like domain-containing protein [Phycicoccus sp. CSK15P-2]